MGSKASRAKKKGGGEQLPPRKPAKQLSAVSEGEERPWSSVNHDEGALAMSQQSAPILAKPALSPSTAGSSEFISSHGSENGAPTRIESAHSVEEKEDSPAETSRDPEPTKYSEPEETSFNSNNYGSSSAYETTAEVKPEPDPEPVTEEPPPREPTPDPLQAGGYLVFSTANDGMLYLQYSQEKVPEAVAYFRPNRVVPAFKYRQNAGRVELIRRLQTNKQLYYDGYADFLKAAKEFDSEVYLIQPTAQVFYQTDGSRVAEAPMGAFFNLRVSNIAVIPPHNKSFEGVKNLHPDQFISTGNKYGKALKF